MDVLESRIIINYTTPNSIWHDVTRRMGISWKTHFAGSQEHRSLSKARLCRSWVSSPDRGQSDWPHEGRVQGSHCYSGFRVDGTYLKMSFTWGFIQTTSWGLCQLLSIHYNESWWRMHIKKPTRCQAEELAMATATAGLWGGHQAGSDCLHVFSRISRNSSFCSRVYDSEPVNLG